MTSLRPLLGERWDKRHRLEDLAKNATNCAVGVTRNDEYQPCDKPAIAARTSQFEGEWFTDPICAYHAHMLSKHGELVPLWLLLGGSE